MKRVHWSLILLATVGFISLCHAERSAEDLVESLREDDEATARASQEILVKMGSDAVRPLQKVLDDANFKVRLRAVEILGRLGPLAKRAAPDLVERLSDTQTDIHDEAEKALIAMGEDAIPALSSALKSHEEGVRQLALKTLSRCGPKSIPILLNLLKNDESSYLRASAAEALGQSHPASSETIQALIVALSDLQEEVRGTAANSLGELGADSKEAVKPLFTSSQEDRDAFVRKKALDALIQIGRSNKELAVEVAAVLNPLLTNENSSKRLDAVHVLGNFGAASMPGLIQSLGDRDETVSQEAGNALVEIGPEAIPALEEQEKSPYPFIQRRAAALLKRMRRKSQHSKK